MSVSKLFTPRLRAAQATPLDKVERAPIFVNPPTHAEVPVFYGPADNAGYHLHTCRDSGTKTKQVSRRPISSKSDHGNY